MDAIKKAVKSYSTSLTNSLAILVVSVAEVLIAQTVFVCPCHPDDTRQRLLEFGAPSVEAANQRKHYALAFIIYPAVAVFFLAVMVNGRLLRCLMDERFSICSLRSQGRGCRYFFMNVSNIVVLPATWFFVILMDGGFYTCAVTKAPNHCLPAADTLNTTALMLSRLQIERENQWHRSTSQIIALTLVGVGGTIAGLFVLCSHLCSTLPYYQRNYMKLYREKELEVFKDVSEKSLKKELKAKWERFFQEADKGDWEAISILPVGSPTVHKDQFYYSAFHSWPEKFPKIHTHSKPGARPASGGRSRVKPEAALSRYDVDYDDGTSIRRPNPEARLPRNPTNYDDGERRGSVNLEARLPRNPTNYDDGERRERVKPVARLPRTPPHYDDGERRDSSVNPEAGLSRYPPNHDDGERQ